MLEFCNLHRHSEFSPLDGTGNAVQYAEQASTVLQQKWLDLTDHATLGGALDHIRACRCDAKPLGDGTVDMDSELRPGEKRRLDEAIIPIVGCEVFWVGGDAWGSRLEKGYDHNVKPHLCLHASGIDGWHSLIQIVTKANVTGFHGVPRVDFDLLREHPEGIVATTACISSPVCRLLKAGDYERAIAFVQELKEILHGRVWVEIMGHDVDDQRFVNPGLVNISQDTSTGLVATTDGHAPFPDWVDTQSLVFSLSRRDTLKKIAEKEEKARETGDEVYGKVLESAYIMTGEEVVDLFAKNHPDIPADIVLESVKNTAEFARGIRPFVVDKDPKVPKVSADARDAERILREWSEDGFERELALRGEAFGARQQEYRERLEFEIDTIRSKGVLDYFVMVGDCVRAAKRAGKNVGPGRGSAAGCLLSYLIGITDLDPIPYGLLFERFMNPDRKGMPDIDVDFSDREWVVQYLIDRYGEENVAYVTTYQTFGPKSIINDVSGYFNDGPHKVEWLDIQKAKAPIEALPAPQQKDIVALRKRFPEVDEFARNNAEPWKHMERMDDGIKSPSKHASAIIVAPRPIREIAPIRRSRGKRSDGSDDTFAVEWADRAAFPIISDYGLFKFDVLGLEELERHEYALDLIEQRTGERPDLSKLPVRWDPDAGEPEVLANFGRGRTLGVFQFASEGMTQLLKAIKPTEIADLIAANALYRPGAMEFAFDYAKRKKGDQEVTFWHDAVVPYLEGTYGLLAYQEQVMQIVRAMGDFTPGQADDMRKAFSKLYRLPGDEAQKFMQRYRSQWDAGCANHGISDEVRDQVWESVLKWGGYGFNKSHSGCYALLAYRDMWLKTHYPQEFYAALLTMPGGTVARDILREAAQMGVRIMKPDVNESERGFRLNPDGSVLYGLVSIKNIGGAAASHVVANRPYASFQDFLDKQDLRDDDEGAFSISDAVNLIKGGAFDAVDDRDYLLSTVPKTEHDVYDIEMTCGCTIKGRKFDPNQPYDFDPDTGEVLEYKSGPRKGQPKLRGKMPRCSKHDCEEWTEVTPRRDSWTVAHHIHHNRKLANPRPVPDVREVPSTRDKRDYEQDVLGISLEGTRKIMELCAAVADVDEQAIGGTVVMSEQEFGEIADRKKVIVGGELVGVKETEIKRGRDKGRKMAFLTVANDSERFSCTLFADDYARHRQALEGMGTILVHGRKDTYNDRSSVVVIDLWDLEAEYDRE